MFYRKIQRVAALAILGMGLWLAGSGNVLAAGLLTPSDGSPQLELRDHKVNVLVEDGYAITTVEQRFFNPHGHDMEAIYSFPVPRKAAVHEFAYWIDGKQISGEVVEKEKARQIYEQEKQAGHETALAEQDAYRTFDIAVWPVRGGSDVRIQISYIQSADIETGIGRYLYPLEEGGVDEQKLAFWTAQETVIGEFAFDLHLRTDYGVEALRVPAHPSAQVWQEADGSWRVQMGNHGAASGESTPPLEPGVEPTGFQPVLEAPEEESFTRQFQPVELNQDIVIYWRQKADEPARVDMVPYKAQAGKRGSFMLTLTPGMDLKPITEGRDWIFVLDTSGSMSGKIATLAEGVSQALVRIRPEDRFRIVLFNDNAQELTSGYVAAREEEIKRAINSLRSLQAGGGTNLYSGLHLGLSMADADRVGAIVLVTDGVANVGKTQAVDFFQLMQSRDLRLFTAIMGNSANRPLLEPLTRASNGFAKSVSNADDVAGILLQATSKVTHQALHGLKIELNPVEGDETGSNLRIADLRRDQVETLYRGEQLVLFGHYWGSGEAELALTGEISGRPVRFETRFSFPETAELNPEIERLWGFAEIERGLEQMALFGPDADMKQSVVDTSLEYGILSPYTSMVVLREERFEALGIERSNRDRLVQEEAALQKRQQQAVVSRRVDQAQPMFNKPRPSHSGRSGDTGLIGLYLAVTLLLIGLSLRRRNSRRGFEQGDT